MKILRNIVYIIETRSPHWSADIFFMFLILGIGIFILLFNSRYNLKQKIASFALYFYSYNVLITTLLMRKTLEQYTYDLIPFSSLFGANMLDFIFNIILFIPIGILTPYLIKRKNKYKLTVLIGFCASLIIESVQLITRLGEFETDDIITNTFGTFVGVIIFIKITAIINKKQALRIG